MLGCYRKQGSHYIHIWNLDPVVVVVVVAVVVAGLLPPPTNCFPCVHFCFPVAGTWNWNWNQN